MKGFFYSCHGTIDSTAGSGAHWHTEKYRYYSAKNYHFVVTFETHSLACHIEAPVSTVESQNKLIIQILVDYPLGTVVANDLVSL